MLLVVALLFIGTLCACIHQHAWKKATCTEPKTCTTCGATEGKALGHNWKEATCTQPKICTVCGKTEGEALGHHASLATCTDDSVCNRCGEIIAKATGHDWVKATVSKPKTCNNCGKTEGDPLGYKFFPMDSYEFIDAYNQSKHALGTLSKDSSNTMRIKGTNLEIVFFVYDVSDKTSGYKNGYWLIPKRDFIEMLIRLQTTGSDRYSDNGLAAITMIGQSFAEVLDSSFDSKDFIDQCSSTTSGKNFTLSYSHKGYEYELQGKSYSYGSGFYTYDFKISLSANKE